VEDDARKNQSARNVFYGREVVDLSSRPSEGTMHGDRSTHPLMSPGYSSPMQDVAMAYMRPEPTKVPSGPSTGEKQIGTVTFVLGAFWIFMLFLFGFATEFDTEVVESKGEMGSLYVYYQQVATMVLVGFGFLYAFLRKYPYGRCPKACDPVFLPP
jgi:hypothetical protein